MAHAIAHPPLQRAIGWLARPPPALRHGLKFGTAMSAAIWVAFASGLDWSLTIWVTVLFVSQPNVGASIKKGLARLWGTVAAALISIAIYGLFSQQPPLMLASLCGALALSTYGMTGPRYPYAWLVFGFTSTLILTKAMAGSDQIETLSFERATLTALGVLVVFVSDLLFWPVRAQEELRESLAARSRGLGDTLKRHLEKGPSEPTPAEAAPPPSSPLIEQLGLADQYRDEIGATPARAQAFSRIALLLEGLASRVRLLASRAEEDSRASTASPSVALTQLARGLHAALSELSRAILSDTEPEPFADELDGLLSRYESERNARAPVLRDVVALLGRLEESLVAIARAEGDSSTANAAEPAAAAVREWIRVDPIRLQLALRAGIAGGGVIVAMLVMGWTFSEDLLPIILAPIVAYIVAGMSSTRGAGTTIGIGLAMGFLLGWLIADLSIVFLFTHLERMPLSLVYPFVVAGGGGYLIVRGSPLGPLGALFGILIAILSVYIGDAAPDDVAGSYGMVCGLFVGLAAGLIAQRFLWPRTAMQIFTERAAGQLDLCLRALGGTEPSGEGTAPGKHALGIVSSYTKQLTLLGKIHAQAHREPVERALDDQRRAELLALTQDLFDAALRAPGPAAREEADVPEEDRAALAPLRAALVRQDEALRASMVAASRTLRGEPLGALVDLSGAHSAVESRRSEFLGRHDLAQEFRARNLGDLLVRVDLHWTLAARQLAIETWLVDWRRAADEARC